MLGQERTVLPLLAEREFGLTAYTSALTFILAFGATKAASNYVAGTLSDRYDPAGQFVLDPRIVVQPRPSLGRAALDDPTLLIVQHVSGLREAE